jgi:hypothetical protein
MSIDIVQVNLKLYYYYLQKALEAAKRLKESYIVPSSGHLLTYTKGSWGREDYDYPDPDEILKLLLEEKVTKENLWLYTMANAKK